MSDVLELMSGELRYILSECDVTKAGVTYNPTSDVIKWAFVPLGTPVASATWATGSWETVGTVYYARCLVGCGAAVGGDVTLAAGTYTAYWKITDSPEIPIEPVGTVSVQA